MNLKEQIERGWKMVADMRVRMEAEWSKSGVRFNRKDWKRLGYTPNRGATGKTYQYVTPSFATKYGVKYTFDEVHRSRRNRVTTFHQ